MEAQTASGKLSEISETSEAATVLVTDNERPIREVVGSVLRSAGFRVLLAHSGHEALRRVERERVDLVLLDIQMPGIDGWTTLERIKRLPQAPPVLMMSGTLDPDRVRASGAAGMLEKPYHPSQVVTAVQQILGTAST